MEILKLMFTRRISGYATVLAMAMMNNAATAAYDKAMADSLSTEVARNRGLDAFDAAFLVVLDLLEIDLSGLDEGERLLFIDWAKDELETAYYYT